MPSNTLTVKSSCSLKMVRVRSEGTLGPLDAKPERMVLVIYTGGTIGMIRNEDGVLEPLPDMFEKKIKSYVQLHDEEYFVKRFGHNTEADYLILPDCLDECRVIYKIIKYVPLLDSSNMSMNDWIRIASDIKQFYEMYDGFVILHGTDTLTYTASALSFMLENLGKSIVVTGSQIPLFEVLSDGIDNFLGALIFASNYVIPEVTIFFHNNLFRGNRTIKISSKSFHAFKSPNIPPLATVSIDIDVDYKSIFRSRAIDKFSVHTTLNQNVGLLRIFPSITAATVKLFLQPPTQGVILQTYGSGNIPSNRLDILEAFREAISRGIIIMNCTQCLEGSVKNIYETGHVLGKVGVISGMDMTPECALSKLSYVLSKDEWDHPTKLDMLKKSIRGELTQESLPQVDKWDLIDAVAHTLNLSSPGDMQQLNDVICPAMLMAAIAEHNLPKIKQLKRLGVDLSMTNHDKSTALHLACFNGNVEIVNYLLLHGCSVHIRDRLDRTPLHEAIKGDHHDVIKLLKKCGAHLSGSARLIGEQLCLAATRGSVARLKSYKFAGADLNQVDSCGRTAMHVAALHGNDVVVQYLLAENCCPTIMDLTGFTPLQLAEQRNHIHVLQLFNDNNFEQFSIS